MSHVKSPNLKMRELVSRANYRSAQSRASDIGRDGLSRAAD